VRCRRPSGNTGLFYPLCASAPVGHIALAPPTFLKGCIRKMSLEELRERIRNAGISPQEKTLPVADSLAIIDRCKNVYKFVAKYAQLTLGSDKPLKIDVNAFNRCRDDLELLCESVDYYCALWGAVMIDAIRIIESVNNDSLERSDPEFIAKRLYQLLRLARRADDKLAEVRT
jgi:hypothetical protein